MACLEDAGERQQAVLLDHAADVGAVHADSLVAGFGVRGCAGPVGC